jgi:hypothetical protein
MKEVNHMAPESFTFSLQKAIGGAQDLDENDEKIP